MVICQKEKCKEMHFKITKQLYKYNADLNDELSERIEELKILNQKYKELKTNYTRLNNKYQKLLKTEESPFSHMRDNLDFIKGQIND